jgi:hypothetical protein
MGTRVLTFQGTLFVLCRLAPLSWERLSLEVHDYTTHRDLKLYIRSLELRGQSS